MWMMGREARVGQTQRLLLVVLQLVSIAFDKILFFLNIVARFSTFEVDPLFLIDMSSSHICLIHFLRSFLSHL